MEKNENNQKTDQKTEVLPEIGKTLKDEDGDSIMQSSPEASFSDELAWNKELEQEEEELVLQLEQEKRARFAKMFEELSKSETFWEEFRKNMFACGFMPHLYDLGHNQFIAMLPLDEDELEDFKDIVDNSYAYIKFNN